MPEQRKITQKVHCPLTSDPADVLGFYANYADLVRQRPGYPARAAYKSYLIWKWFGQTVKEPIRTCADIGGCYGFTANAFAVHAERRQEIRPHMTVYELSQQYADVAAKLFPEIEYRIHEYDGEYYDAILLFDVVEHVLDPSALLQALKAKYIFLKTPLEPVHSHDGEGHVNFFTVASYENLLRQAGLNILQAKVVPTIIPCGAHEVLSPECTRPWVTAAKAIASLCPPLLYRQALKLTKVGIHFALCVREGE